MSGPCYFVDDFEINLVCVVIGSRFTIYYFKRVRRREDSSDDLPIKENRFSMLNNGQLFTVSSSVRTLESSLLPFI